MFAKRTNWNLAPNRLSEALAVYRAAGKPMLDLTVSNPTECGFEYDGSAILNALSNPAVLSYEPNPRGLESARRAVAGYYAERKDEVSIEDIFLTTSTSEAYSYVFRTLCDHGWQIDFHALERAITPRTRGVIFVHPNNPTGHFAKQAEIARLNSICYAREMAIIADEVFLDFRLAENRP